MTTVKTIKLEGPALEISKTIIKLHNQIEFQKKDMQRRFDQEWKGFIETHGKQMEAAFDGLEQVLGFPVKDGFELDASYFEDHGEVFLKPATATEPDLMTQLANSRKTTEQ